MICRVLGRTRGFFHPQLQLSVLLEWKHPGDPAPGHGLSLRLWGQRVGELYSQDWTPPHLNVILSQCGSAVWASEYLVSDTKIDSCWAVALKSPPACWLSSQAMEPNCLGFNLSSSACWQGDLADYATCLWLDFLTWKREMTVMMIISASERCVVRIK